MKGTDSLLCTGTYHKNLAIWKKNSLKYGNLGNFVPGVGIIHFFNCIKFIFFKPFFDFICLNHIFLFKFLRNLTIFLLKKHTHTHTIGNGMEMGRGSTEEGEGQGSDFILKNWW
jgi:hypothetical protein